MCLGIPGQIVEVHPQHDHLARVDVSGVGRMINIGLLEDEHLMQMMGEIFTDEVDDRMTRG